MGNGGANANDPIGKHQKIFVKKLKMIYDLSFDISIKYFIFRLHVMNCKILGIFFCTNVKIVLIFS